MKLQCSYCQKQMDAGQELSRGQRVECPYCAKTFTVDTGTVVKELPVKSSVPAPVIKTESTPNGVKIVGISIPFFDMVLLLLEIALAAIPACLALWAIFYLLAAVLFKGLGLH